MTKTPPVASLNGPKLLSAKVTEDTIFTSYECHLLMKKEKGEMIGEHSSEEKFGF
jgi:hypothetical protein